MCRQQTAGRTGLDASPGPASAVGPWVTSRGSCRAILAAVALVAAAGCHDDRQRAGSTAGAQQAGDTSTGRYSANARPELVQVLRDDLLAPRSRADGGGRAWLDLDAGARRDAQVVAGRPASFAIVYEAGPLGVAEGGAVYLQSPPFWYWDAPQTLSSELPGYTEVRTDADGVELESLAAGQGLLVIEIGGRALRQGERIHIDYTSRADRYAERDSRIWIAVDGDGDGVRRVLADSPAVDVVAGPPARLVATLPTTARPGDTVRLTVAVLDAWGSAGVSFDGEITLTVPDGLSLPGRVSFDGDDDGRLSVEGVVAEPGVFRVQVTGADGLEALSNPLVVTPSAPRVLWADLHGHSNLSDGTGTPDDYYAYARDVAGLDVAALTDHDHWGILALDQHPDMWDAIAEAAERHHEPGRFVTLLGYEWTSWLYGHRHVLFFGDRGEVWSTLDAATETPTGLWKAVAAWHQETGVDALTFAHHSAGDPVATDWSFVPDPHVEPVTEIVSVHGSSEAADSPVRVGGAVAGNFVRDVLDRGLRFGFVGSGDSHDGHPGLAHLAAPSGGLAAILSDDLTREAVLAALRARRTYATNGPRLYLRFSLDGHPMGSTIPPARADSPSEQELDWAVSAAAPVARVVLIGRGGIVADLEADESAELSGRVSVPRLAAGDYLYLRVEQVDGGLAWTSPVYQD